MPATIETHVLTNPKNNQTLETTLSDDEALSICNNHIEGHDQEFARSLVRSSETHRGLSQGQLYWVHLLAMKWVQDNEPIFDGTQTAQAAPIEPPAPEAVQMGDFARLTRIFTHAVHYRPDLEEQNRKARRLRIILETDSGKPVQLMLASENSKYTGQLMISNGLFGDGNVYYGRVDLNGFCHPTRQMDAEVLDLLLLFAQSPYQVVKDHGRKTGKCCFCNRKLEDEKGDAETQKGSSVEQGMGLVCARRYGFYHTNLTVAQKQDYWTREGREDWMQ